MSASRTSTSLSSAARSSTALAAAARSSALMHKVDSDFDSQLAYKSCPTLLPGLGLLLVGGLALAGGLCGWFGPNSLMLDVVSGSVLAAGLVLGLLRLGLTVDRKLRRIVKWRWFGVKQASGVYNLSPFDFLTISQSGRGSRLHYEICMSDSNSNFQVATFPSEPEAQEFAAEVARFLNVRIVDSVSGEWQAVR